MVGFALFGDADEAALGFAAGARAARAAAEEEEEEVCSPPVLGSVLGSDGTENQVTMVLPRDRPMGKGGRGAGGGGGVFPLFEFAIDILCTDVECC
jgi:hypothetical protein